jgi:hypothetical protein
MVPEWRCLVRAWFVSGIGSGLFVSVRLDLPRWLVVGFGV